MAITTGPSNGPPNTNVVGAGPFVLKSYIPGEKIILVKNPKYWDAKAIPTSGVDVHQRSHRTPAAQRARVRPGGPRRHPQR